MKNAVFLAMLGAAAFCAPAHAQITYDVSKVSCADYTAMDPVASQDFSAWMSGWFNQRANDTTLNLEGYHKNVANVQAWCASNPKANLMAGLEAAAAKAKNGVPGPTDINAAQITCGQFLSAPADDQLTVASWLGGWFMSTKNLTVIDTRYVHRNSQKIGEYCKKHKKETMFSAVQKNWK